MREIGRDIREKESDVKGGDGKGEGMSESREEQRR